MSPPRLYISPVNGTTVHAALQAGNLEVLKAASFFITSCPFISKSLLELLTCLCLCHFCRCRPLSSSLLWIGQVLLIGFPASNLNILKSHLHISLGEIFINCIFSHVIALYKNLLLFSSINCPIYHFSFISHPLRLLLYVTTTEITWISFFILCHFSLP